MSDPVPLSDPPSSSATMAPRRAALDTRAFDALFRECASDVHGYAISLLGDAAAAEDVTALAFERLYRARSRLDRRRGTPRAWLFAIARNAALDELRARRRRPQQHLEHTTPADDSGAGEALEDVEHRATVRDALAKLALRDRGSCCSSSTASSRTPRSRVRSASASPTPGRGCTAPSAACASTAPSSTGWRSREGRQLPRGEAAAREQRWNVELKAALAGDGQGPAADCWRELRADVRSLAPPLDPELEAASA